MWNSKIILFLISIWNVINHADREWKIENPPTNILLLLKPNNIVNSKEDDHIIIQYFTIVALTILQILAIKNNAVKPFWY